MERRPIKLAPLMIHPRERGDPLRKRVMSAFAHARNVSFRRGRPLASQRSGVSLPCLFKAYQRNSNLTLPFLRSQWHSLSPFFQRRSELNHILQPPFLRFEIGEKMRLLAFISADLDFPPGNKQTRKDIVDGGREGHERVKAP